MKKILLILSTIVPWVCANAEPVNLFYSKGDGTHILENYSGDYSLSGTLPESVRVEANKPVIIPLYLINNGLQTVDSFDYSYSIGDITGTGTQTLAESMPADLTATKRVDIELPALDETGDYSCELSITGVNGHTIQDSDPVIKTTLRALSVLPVKRPVMEEFTGTWCGWCVTGIATIEYMKKKYPDEFIAIAYHIGNSDPMYAFTGEKYARYPTNLPNCFIDRGAQIDPYKGYLKDGFGFETAWLESREDFSPVAMSLSGSVTRSGGNMDVENMEATLSYRFVEPYENDCQIVWVVLEDNMKGNSIYWNQTNYYSRPGYKAENYIDEMARFCNGIPEMTDMVYDDVAVGARNLNGISGEDIEKDVDVDYTATASFESRDLVTIADTTLVQPEGVFSIVALIVDKESKKILNAVKAPLFQTVGQEDIEAEKVIKTERFDISGMRLASPAKGINIRREILGDGTIRTSKIIMK